MSFNKFLLRLLLFACPIICLIIILEIAIRNIPTSYERRNWDIQNQLGELDVLILGASHLHNGIDPALLKFRTYNLSLPGSPFRLNYLFLNKILKQKNKLKYLIIEVSYLSMSDLWNYPDVKGYLPLYRYYFNLSINDFEVENLLLVTARTNPGILTNLMNYYFLDAFDSIKVRSDGFDPINGHILENALQKESQIRARIYHDIPLDTINNILYLNKLVDLAEMNNKKILFITAPAPHSFVKSLSKNRISRISSLLQSIAERHPHVKYYNLLEDTRFIYSDFFDANHLNTRGATKLTNILDSLLNQRENQ